ncbi:MAG: SDR family oxidoreductase [Pseudomonadota bacterium]
MTDFGLSGKSVLVTGASRGIGYAIAEAFVSVGATVQVLAETDEVFSAAENLSMVRADTPDVQPVLCDVTDGDAIAAAVGAIGGLDILINNAGLEKETALDDPTSIDRFTRIMDINVNGMFRVTQAALPKLGAGSVILNTASIWGRFSPPAYSAYAASKHAVIGLTRSFARELGPRGIRVNAVCPGWVGTEAALDTLKVMAEAQGKSEEALANELSSDQDVPGLMSPEDVTSLYLFLASDLAANITGQAIHVDRGEYQA